MLGQVWQNPVVRFAVIGTSVAVLSEVIFQFYRRVRKEARRPAKVSDVIWTNELTQLCANHKNGQQKPCDNPYCTKINLGKIVALIDKAMYTIDLAMYTFTSIELSYAFSRAMKRGVDVRIISDKEMIYSCGSQIKTLVKNGIPGRAPNSTMLMHHKFCIIDGPKRAAKVLSFTGRKYNHTTVQGILLSGSLNWTAQGFGSNWENILITSCEHLVPKYEEEFERMWRTFNYDMQTSLKK